MNLPKEAYLLAINKAITMTYNRYKKLTNTFEDDFEKAYYSSDEEWRSVGLSPKTYHNYVMKRHLYSPTDEYNKLLRCHAEVIYPYDTRFPSELWDMENPAGILYLRGSIESHNYPNIAVVGSRKMTSYTKRATENIVSDLAKNNITITSGLAYGVDTIAHKACVDAGTKTIAVLGSSIDNLHPASNKAFAEQCLKDNTMAVISELAPDAPSSKEHFLTRNRLVVALSSAVIVMQASEKSGSISTAHYALKAGKEVFTIPAELYIEAYEGTNRLLSEGLVRAITSAQDVLYTMNLSDHMMHKEAQKTLIYTDEEAVIMSLFDSESTLERDDIMRLSPLPEGITSATIVILELKGMLINRGNNVFQKGV